MEVIINYWAVLLAAIAAFVLGGLWFGPFFGKTWMKLAGIHMPHEMTKAMRSSMMRSYAVVAIFSLVMATVLAHLLFYMNIFTGVYGVDTGVTTAIWCWLGFVVPATLGSVLWEGRSWKYWFIVAGYWLVAMIIAGIILAAWR
ncbi:MAG: DUF1761 domain-containing protein [Patescibacteria group bacterium]